MNERGGPVGGRRDRLIATSRGVWRRFGANRVTDQAAALTYYGFLSLFPAMIMVVAVIAVVGSYPETYRSIISTLREAAPGAAVDTLDDALRDALRDRGTAGGLLGVGLLLALWSASSGIGAALRSLRSIAGVEDQTSWLAEIGRRLALTLAVMATLGIAFAAMLVAGPLFSSISEAAGIDDSVSTAIALLRWPVGVLALACCALLLYRFAGGPGGSLRALVPGAIAASLLWALASVGFSIYVSNFGSYDATYGSLGVVIVLLVWLWIGNVALLGGAALNAELADEGRD